MSERVEERVREVAVELRDDLERLARRAARGEGPAILEPLVGRCLDECLERLAATGCRGPANRMPSQVLWRLAGSLLETGSLQHHAYRKPRGYAGDYEMLDWICRESCCDHPLGTLFDRYFQRQAAPRAVRRRVERVSRQIVARVRRGTGSPVRVVSLGCGPASDVAGRSGSSRPNARSMVRVMLLDLDPRALELASQRLRGLVPHRPTCIQVNLSRLARRPGAASLIGPADLLVCTGFFDYLSDAAAVQLLELCWRSLAPGGGLTIYNFASGNPSRAYMEWIGNWYLTYRTAESVHRLGLAAGIPDQCLSVQPVSEGHLVELTARRDFPV